jgi:WD40-like Beta Propeller Repeat
VVMAGPNGDGSKSIVLAPEDEDEFGVDNVGSLSPDGKLVAIEGRSTVHLFDMTDGSQVGSLPVIYGYRGAEWIRWSDDGNMITYKWTFGQWSFAIPDPA